MYVEHIEDTIKILLTSIPHDDDEKRKERSDQVKYCTVIRNKLQGGLIPSLKPIACSKLLHSGISDLFDKETMYIGFNNGYYDLNTMEFKPYTPEIYITMTTGYDYVPSNNELRNELMNILNKIFPDPVLMDYVLLHLSSCLDGLNENELVHFYTGLNDNNGSNGKSLLCSIINKCFGDYSINGHPSIITSSTENPESANSSIMVLNKKKIVIFQEIENNGKKLNDIRLK